MITLKKDSRQARLFRWCLQNPMARGSYIKEDGTCGERPVEWYLENGTTLCHYFWACLWAPMLIAVAAGLVLAMLGLMHMQAYDKLGPVGLLLPSGVVLGMALGVGAIFLAIIGAGKIGLSAYLMALKQKMCPRLEFVATAAKDEAPDAT